MAQQPSTTTVTYEDAVQDASYRLPCGGDCDDNLVEPGSCPGWYFDHERLVAEQSVLSDGPICHLSGGCPEYLEAIPTRGILNTCARGRHVTMSPRLREVWPTLQAQLLAGRQPCAEYRPTANVAGLNGVPFCACGFEQRQHD